MNALNSDVEFTCQVWVEAVIGRQSLRVASPTHLPSSQETQGRAPTAWRKELLTQQSSSAESISALSGSQDPDMQWTGSGSTFSAMLLPAPPPLQRPLPGSEEGMTLSVVLTRELGPGNRANRVAWKGVAWFGSTKMFFLS